MVLDKSVEVEALLTDELVESVVDVVGDVVDEVLPEEVVFEVEVVLVVDEAEEVADVV